MSWRDLLRRELRLVFGARVTWFVLAAAALLLGHGFVLALDLFTAASRSAVGFGLMQREMDPLAGIIRPLLGALQLIVALLVPVIAARGLAIERERRSYGSLALAAGGTTPIVLAKGLSALAASCCLLLPVFVLLALFASLGGHIDVPETAIAIFGHFLHLVAFTFVALAAAALTTTVAQATVAAMSISLISWAIDAGEGFAALAWVGRLEWASVTNQLARFDQGILPLGSIAFFVALGGTALLLALFAARMDRSRFHTAKLVAMGLAGILVLAMAQREQKAFDWSESRRASLPLAAVSALRDIPETLRIELFLDRDDGRRLQVERDALAKLRLARPDTILEMPLDDRDRPREGARDDTYGRIVVHVGNAARETRSTSRRELIYLIFEAAGRPFPDWTQSPYAGFPLVVENLRRTITLFMAYCFLPIGFLVVGWFVVRIKRSP